MTTTSMTCNRVDELLADLLEGTLDATTRHAVEAHRVSCLRCAALVRDLDRIRQDAAALPPLEPSRDLWEGILERIDREVVASPAFGSSHPAAPALSRRRMVRWGLAAAALITVSSGVTYYATMSRVRDGVDSTAVAQAPPASPAAEPSTTPTATTRVADTTLPPSGATAMPVAASRARASAVMTYDREIAGLRKVLDQRRADLDPTTVAVIEHSLSTIDQAIAEARAALVSDPASNFLNDQLNKALEKKLGLLRTVALLPRA